MDEINDVPDNLPHPPSQPIQTYSLEEVVAMVLPPEMKSGRRWLMQRLKSGRIRGYKVGRVWRMTHADVEELIASHRNDAAPKPPASDPDQNPWGLSPRSFRYRQRYGPEGNPNLQKPKTKRANRTK